MTALPAAWPDPVLAAALLAVDPAGLGIRLRAPAGPARDGWLRSLRSLLPPDHPIRRCPPGIADDRLLGGLDLPATIAAGRRVAGSGLLAEADGGLVALPMAERLSPAVAARLAAILDAGEVVLERDGFAARHPARIGIVALDEGRDEDDPPPGCLLDRLALVLALDDALPATIPAGTADAVTAAQRRLPAVTVPDAVIDALCRTALLAGIDSIRAPLLALRAARAVAALHGRDAVTDADAATAARLVLAPRATRLPEAAIGPDAADHPPERHQDPSPDAAPELDRPDRDPAATDAAADAATAAEDAKGGDTREAVLDAVRAALPPNLLARLRPSGAAAIRPSAGSGGRVESRLAARRAQAVRGRPIGTRPGDPSRGRLDLLATLRAAFPWQTLRHREASALPGRPSKVVEVRREDFRLTRFAPRLRATTIFAVDASGSSARHRLDEAKGCVELLLAECYVRRDQVALLAFRGRGSALVLPPTGSVVRARRALQDLPGGGGTPLAAGLDMALALADRLRRNGELALLVLLTDGRANVARDGTADRAVAGRDALDSGTRIRAAGLATLLVDISPRPNAVAAALASHMGACYLPLPQVGAETLARAVRDAMPAA